MDGVFALRSARPSTRASQASCSLVFRGILVATEETLADQILLDRPWRKLVAGIMAQAIKDLRRPGWLREDALDFVI